MTRRAGSAGPQTKAVGDAVQETWQRGGVADGGGPAGQDEEGGLEDVLGVLLVAQRPPADAPDMGAVPGHQRREGRLVAVPKALEAFAIGRGRAAPPLQEAAHVPQQHPGPHVRHRPNLLGTVPFY
jgi:hypothetical protein